MSSITDVQHGQLRITVCAFCGETAPLNLVEHRRRRTLLGVPAGSRHDSWSLECGECFERHDDIDEDQARGWARGLVLQQRYARSETMRRRG